VGYCLRAKRMGPVKVQPCGYRATLHLESLIWTRGAKFPCWKLPQRLRCPRCGGLNVEIYWTPGPSPEAGGARSVSMQGCGGAGLMEMLPIWPGPVGPHLPQVKHCWTWVHCNMTGCGHYRAVPLAPWRIRWGREDVYDAIRDHFYCSVCGRKKCDFVQPYLSGEGVQAFPTRGDHIWIGGERVYPETYPEAEERNRREYFAKYASGDALGEFEHRGTLTSACRLFPMTNGRRVSRTTFSHA
jgi:hypothetical protein